MEGRKHKEAQGHFDQFYKDKLRGHVSLHATTTSEHAFKSLIRWSSAQGRGPELVLVEFPGVILPAFQHTLEAMKQMKEQEDIGLIQYLIPSPGNDVADIQMPTYATRPGFKFDLTCLTHDGDSLFFEPGIDFDVAELHDRTSLDETQAIAMHYALANQLALIQGPPGTGKSYVGVALMRVLLASKKSGE